MITVQNLIKAYKGIAVVNITQLEVVAGEIIGLVGNNGAGKTTFFRLILDLIRQIEATYFQRRRMWLPRRNGKSTLLPTWMKDFNRISDPGGISFLRGQTQ